MDEEERVLKKEDVMKELERRGLHPLVSGITEDPFDDECITVFPSGISVCSLKEAVRVVEKMSKFYEELTKEWIEEEENKKQQQH